MLLGVDTASQYLNFNICLFLISFLLKYRNLAPEWEKAATTLKGVVKVAAVDASVHEKLAGKYQIQGFPTIKVYFKIKYILNLLFIL